MGSVERIKVTLSVPAGMIPFIKEAEKDPLGFAPLLYPAIQKGKLSYSQAAEIFGVSRLDLIDYLGEKGFDYVSCTEDELKQDLEAVKDRSYQHGKTQ